MYDTEKRIELVKKRMYEYHRRQERRTVRRLSVLCTPAVPVPCGGNGDYAKPANKRHGNVRRQFCCMKVQAVMCWWLSFPLLWQS